MRKYEFRGKEKDNEKWVYGSLIITDDSINNPFQSTPAKKKYQICQYDAGDWNLGGWSYYDIYPETVGQFTGLKDDSKEKVKLYDKDIISDANGFKKVICWEEEKARFCLKNIIALKYENTQYINQGMSQEYINELGFVKVGNVFDNPELLNK